MKADIADMAAKARALMASFRAQDEPRSEGVGFAVDGGYVRIWHSIADYEALMKADCEARMAELVDEQCYRAWPGAS